MYNRTVMVASPAGPHEFAIYEQQNSGTSMVQVAVKAPPVPRAQPAATSTLPLDLASPFHSPQDSLNSKISTQSRASLQPLTLHEYRRQQNSPASHTAARPSRTLRRKAAAPALNGLQNAQPTQEAPRSDLRPARQLHYSHSASPLNSHRGLDPISPESPPIANPFQSPLRSQSAGPYHSNAPKQLSVCHSNSRDRKVSNWKPIKRLPRPESPPLPTTPPPLPFPPPTRYLSSVAPPSPSSTDKLLSTDARTDSSTFSLSRFPQPPYLFEPPLSPPNDDGAPSHVTTSFIATTTATAAIAPATPPATPAVIHYRGTSFDLVNPHDSLLLHEIETPSRDFDSTDYLPLRSSEEYLISPEPVSPQTQASNYGYSSSHQEMARRGRLFEDFSSAFNSIANREVETKDPELCSPPPAVLSRELSHGASPQYDHDAGFPLSSRSSKRSPAEARFSLKQIPPLRQLTRTFTRRGRDRSRERGEELLDMQPSRSTVASSSVDGRSAQSLNDSYQPVVAEHVLDSNRGAYPTQEPLTFTNSQSFQTEEQRYPTTLSSMFPDGPSTEIGRATGERMSLARTDPSSRPYYDEVSIYPSSSVYDHDSETGDRYSASLGGLGDSRHISDLRRSRKLEAESNVYNDYACTSIYSFADTSAQQSHRSSGLPALRTRDQRIVKEEEKTDTISKLIEQYNEDYGTCDPKISERSAFITRGNDDLSYTGHASQHLNQGLPLIQSVQQRMPRATEFPRHPGSPPRSHPPIASVANYEPAQYTMKEVNLSEALSGSSYGDTRQLLRIPHSGFQEKSEAHHGTFHDPLTSSSSYSQNGDPKSSPPEDALLEAEKIFQEAAIEGRGTGQPLMWEDRWSGHLPRHISANATAMIDDDQDEWETVGAGSHRAHVSNGSSIADYSSSDDDDGSVRRAFHIGSPLAHSIPYVTQSPPPYRHPSPLSTHDNPFSSSPPVLGDQKRLRDASDISQSLLPSSPPQLSSTPPMHANSYDTTDHMRGLLPVMTLSPYTLSEKETRELLDSGPNDEILYEDSSVLSRSSFLGRMDSNAGYIEDTPSPIQRENTFEKLSVVGPRGNLTGSPGGTGMHEAGSSIADTSSPGTNWKSSPGTQQYRRGSEFYHEPDRTSSVTRIHQRRYVEADGAEVERSPSEETLFPSRYHIRTLLKQTRPASVRSPSYRAMQHNTGRGRAAVAGQTKLREMVLASDARTISSCRSTHFSQFPSIGGSDRPSTSNTHTPLRNHAINRSLATMRNAPIASEDSPHLLCPERANKPEDEAQRRTLSWVIFGLFCLFPPGIILYRWFGDLVITEFTKGRLGSCAPFPKKVATYAGIFVNFGLAIAIIVPIIYMHLTGSL